MKKIISMFLALIMLASVVPMSVFAAEETAEPFTDVKLGRWYTEPVMWCYSNGLMTGTSETTFSPSGEMTRAMFATVLAAMADAKLESAEYKGTFNDVAEGRWYTAAVEWAAENEIVSGIGGGAFGRNNPVTRETIVLMVYKFMQYMGVDTTVKLREKALFPYGDVEAVHSWAKEAMEWAVSNEVISGTAVVNGAPMLSPRNTATRAEVAVIVKNIFSLNLETATPVGQLLLAGTDVSEFVIVYGETANYGRRNNTKDIADFLQQRIIETTGIELPIYSHNDLPAVKGANEILIGHTNREDAGFVTVDREGVEGDALFYEMQGSYLILASDEENLGTYLAANRFCEDVLGYENFGNGISGYSSIKTASLEDGVRVDDAPYFELFVNHQRDGWNAFFSPSESATTFINIVHSIPLLACDGDCGYEFASLVTDHGHHVYHHMDSDPCLSDSHNIRTVIANVKTLLESRERGGSGKLIWLCQSDGEEYCKCESCRQIYALFGRCATYVQLLNYVGEAIAEDYPEYKVVGLAYKYTMRPPNLPEKVTEEKYAAFVESYTQDIVPPRDITSPANVVMCICTDNSCYSHAIDDPTCEHKGKNNVTYEKNFTTWCEIIPNIYIWDYLTASAYHHTPWPNIHSIYRNYQYFYNKGVTGVYALGISDYIGYGDFGDLRTYLIAEINMNPTMTEAEYWSKVDGFLKASYGPGYTYIHEYIDQIEKLSSGNEFHNWMTSWWCDIITEQDWEENYDYLRSLWDKALECAETDDQISRVKTTMTQILYVELQMAYHKYESTGLESDLAAFRVLNEAYVLHLDEVGFARPGNWAPNGNPDKWES